MATQPILEKQLSVAALQAGQAITLRAAKATQAGDSVQLAWCVPQSRGYSLRLVAALRGAWAGFLAGFLEPSAACNASR